MKVGDKVNLWGVEGVVVEYHPRVVLRAEEVSRPGVCGIDVPAPEGYWVAGAWCVVRFVSGEEVEWDLE